MSHIFAILNGSLNLIATGFFLVIIFPAKAFRRDRCDVSFLLTSNSCLASLLTCLVMCLMLVSNLSTGFLTQNNDFCNVIGLIYDVCQCSIYYSYFLQAIFRLFRIVFYQKRILVNYTLYRVLILLQWMISLVCLLPPFFSHWYVTLPTEHYCIVPYTSIGPAVYQMITLYLIPMICIATISIWISLYIRRSSHAVTNILSGNQKRRNDRDLAMIQRLILMIIILVLMRCPTFIFMIYAIIFNSVHPVAFSVSGSIVSLCLIFIGIMTISFTPKFQTNIAIYLFCQRNRVHVRESIQRHRLASIAIRNIPITIENQSRKTFMIQSK